MTRDLPGLLPGLDLIRQDFPILQRTMVDGHPLVYLDSANTSQKPQVVIDTMVDHLERHNANVARAMNQLGAESSEAFEDARMKFDVRYYLIAIQFIVFDLEIIFIVPWTQVFMELGARSLVTMGLFVGMLFLGFIYVWKKGALEWE